MLTFASSPAPTLEHMTRRVVQTDLVADLVFVYVEIVRLPLVVANVGRKGRNPGKAERLGSVNCRLFSIPNHFKHKLLEPIILTPGQVNEGLKERSANAAISILRIDHDPELADMPPAPALLRWSVPSPTTSLPTRASSGSTRE